jgi:hypothetical protein
MALREKRGTVRGILRILFIILLVIGCAAIILFTTTPLVTFGAESNPTGNPLGGGAGYRQVYTENDVQATYIADTKDEFLSALARATAGDVIYVPERANIDLTGVMGTSIPGGVTIASNRGVNGSMGGRIFQERLPGDPTTTGGKVRSMFYIDGDDVRITGLRLEGPDKTTTRLSSIGLGERNGISVYDRNNLEVDNCEVWGWSWSGVRISFSNNGYAYIHHNYIHHCQDSGFGYGVALYGGTALVEGNIFDYVKNPVAGAGHVGEGYEARYNLVNHTTSESHSFDIHPYTNPATGQVIAGSSYRIHHNTVKEASIFAVGIVGVPLEGVWIDHNKFQWTIKTNGTYPPVAQTKGVGKVFMTRNLIGTPEVFYEEGPIYVWYSM